jgi:hypothetical protein
LAIVLQDLSTTNMTNWPTVATAVDDTIADLKSCSVKRRRAGPSINEEKREHRTKALTFASSLP